MSEVTAVLADEIRAVHLTLRDCADAEKYGRILEQCGRLCDAPKLALYRLVRREGRFEPIASSGYDAPRPAGSPPADDGVFVAAIESAPGSLTGWLQVEPSNGLSEAARSFIAVVAAVLSLEFEIDWTNRAMTEIVAPVSLAQTESAYLTELARLARTATDMSYVAFRRHEEVGDGLMRCVGFAGLEPEQLDLDALAVTSEHPRALAAFLDVLRGSLNECRIFVGAQDPVIQDARRLPGMADIATLVIAPLSIGAKKLGTMSFSLNFEAQIPSVQRNMFLTVANMAAAALSHYDESAQLSETKREAFQQMRAMVNNELLQGLRHATKNALEAATSEVKLLESYLAKRKSEDVKEQVDRVSESIEAAVESVGKMDVIRERSSTVTRKARLDEVFRQACHLVMYQLNRHRIEVNTHPSGASAEINEDAIRYAFLNLLLNSIEAFEGAPERGRKITLVVEERDDRILLTYSDNGPGLTLKPPVLAVNDIWKAGFTTKKKGTGYGLPFVRSVVQDQHGGTIEVAEHRRGMSFKIQLYKQIPTKRLDR